MICIRNLAIVSCLGIALATPSACSQSDESSRSTRRAISQSQAIAADFLRTELALSPETASRLDLEDYLGPTTIYQLDNHSQAGFERRRLVRIELLDRLQRRPPLPEDHGLILDLAIAEVALVDLISLEQLGYGRFDYAEHRPYALDAFSGVWIEGPELLTFRQSINSVNDATAFIARLQSLSAAIQDTKRRLIADRASGIILPRQLAQASVRRIGALLSDDPSALPLLMTTFEALSLDVPDLEGDQRVRMLALVENEVETKLRPALQDLLETLANQADPTMDQAGIWAQPKGQSLYSGILNALTGDKIATDRLHVRHLADVEAARAVIEGYLSLPETLADQAPERPESMAGLLPWYESLVTEPPLAIGAEEAEPQLEQLEDLAPKPDWDLIAKTPVFQAQADALQAYRGFWLSEPYRSWHLNQDLAPHRDLIEYPAIKDAWRLYAWSRLSDETEPLAMAAHDSIDLIQAVLAAADTGLHFDRWTLGEASDYIAVNTGLDAALSQQLALRIMARPGYQTAIRAVYHRFETLSERSQAVLGERYSETDFQRTLIQSGPRPLAFIETDIEAWYGARLSD